MKAKIPIIVPPKWKVLLASDVVSDTTFSRSSLDVVTYCSSIACARF